MHEEEYAGAKHREGAEHQRHARRQRGGGDQYRAKKQEGERILQPAGEEQQHRELRDIEGEQPGRAVGLQPLRQAKATRIARLRQADKATTARQA